VVQPTASADIVAVRDRGRGTQAHISHLSPAISLLEKRMGQLKKTACGNAWGIFGSIVGYATGSFWAQVHPNPFLNNVELSTLGYAAFLAFYMVITKSHFGTGRCLSKARLYFIAGDITESEYNRVRSKCLKDGGLL